MSFLSFLRWKPSAMSVPRKLVKTRLTAGGGGFVAITSHARKIVFSGWLQTKAEVGLTGSGFSFATAVKFIRMVEKFEHVTFSAARPRHPRHELGTGPSCGKRDTHAALAPWLRADGMATMSAVHLNRNGQIVGIRLENPAQLTCFSADMLAQFAPLLDAIETSQVRLALVTATPEKCSCPGADITGWGGLSPRDFARHWVRSGHRIFDRLVRPAQPMFTLMESHAFGGGLELTCACDLRVMVPGATISLPETGLGITPDSSRTQLSRESSRKWSYKKYHFSDA